MIRAVLAVLVVLAIFGVSQPVIQQGRQDHAATLLAEEVDEFVEQSQDLVRTDEAVGGPGARRIVTVELPADRRFSAGASYLEIDGGARPTVEWATEGGDRRRRVLDGLSIRTPGDGPLRLERSGTHRLLLSLGGSPGEPIVDVDRFDPTGGDSNA